VPQLSFLDRISRTLRAHYDATANEPLPRRWIDLINYLNETELKQAEAGKPEKEQRRRRPRPRSH
jgi:hypothetical protein